MSLSFIHKDRVDFTRIASMIRYAREWSLVAKTKLNKPTGKRSIAKRKNHTNKPPISQIQQRHHFFLLKYWDGSSEANF